MMAAVRFRKGFVFGRFMPPHRGHMHLIDTAASEVDQLTILLSSTDSDTIPGALRASWLEAMYPMHRIIHVNEGVVSYPEGHRDLVAIRTDVFQRYLPGDTEVLFTSEEYGFTIARELGIIHGLIDGCRAVLPVSTAAIRAAPFAHWNFIPEIVRPWFVKRVAVLGRDPNDTAAFGRQLADTFHTIYVDENAGVEDEEEIQRAAARANRILIAGMSRLPALYESRESPYALCIMTDADHTGERLATAITAINRVIAAYSGIKA